VRIIDGWLESARKVPSPNHNERPEGESVSLLVIHSISLPPGVYGGDAIDRLFTNTLDPSAHAYFESIAGLQVSAHLLIRRDGEFVQYVDFRQRAWHAGASCFEGRSGCNDFSIGIEMEGTDTDGFEAAQYAALASVTHVLMAAWPLITPDRITGHSDVAPGRKTDPGSGFDWGLYRRLIGSERADCV
jgi:AmpD protein